MSDGPYKSLPMPKPWKDVAERAQKESFSHEEREESMCVALRNDFARDAGQEYLNAIGHILGDQAQGNLLADQVALEIDNITKCQSHSPLRDIINVNIQVALLSSDHGEQALVEGLNLAIQEYGRGRNRQVEEHYKRDAQNYGEHQKAISVREKLAQTLNSNAVRNLGQDILQSMCGTPLKTKLVKASGLDDGPVVIG